MTTRARAEPVAVRVSSGSKAGRSDRQLLTWGIAVAIGLAAVAAFLPILNNRFVDQWDDGANFLENPAFRGLGWPQVRWAWTTLWQGVYQPIGLDARGSGVLRPRAGAGGLPPGEPDPPRGQRDPVLFLDPGAGVADTARAGTGTSVGDSRDVGVGRGVVRGPSAPGRGGRLGLVPVLSTLRRVRDPVSARLSARLWRGPATSRLARGLDRVLCRGTGLQGGRDHLAAGPPDPGRRGPPPPGAGRSTAGVWIEKVPFLVLAAAAVFLAVKAKIDPGSLDRSGLGKRTDRRPAIGVGRIPAGLLSLEDGLAGGAVGVPLPAVSDRPGRAAIRGEPRWPWRPWGVWPWSCDGVTRRFRPRCSPTRSCWCPTSAWSRTT